MRSSGWCSIGFVTPVQGPWGHAGMRQGTHFSFPQSSLSGVLTLVVRKAMSVCMSHLTCVAMNNS